MSLTGLSDQPLTVKQVCELIFSDAIPVASLMVEHRRGNLQISKIGRTYLTTLADLEEMFRKCRVEAPTRYFGRMKISERMRLFDEAAAVLALIKTRHLEQKGTHSMPDQMPLSDRMRRHRLLSQGAQTVSPSELPDDLPLSLKEVCERVFGGAISVASLKAEYARGNLKLSKIGRAYFTTPADLKAMFEKCRVTPPNWVAVPPRGSPNQVKLSDEAYAESAHAALKLSLERRREQATIASLKRTIAELRKRPQTKRS
jgi:hypothetical protein